MIPNPRRVTALVVAGLLALPSLAGIGALAAPVMVAAPDLEIAKDGPAIVVPGRQVEYTLRYTNSGSAPALGVLVWDTLPAGLNLVSADPSGVPVGGQWRWHLGDLATGAGGAIRVTALAAAELAAGTVITNSARVSEMAGADEEPGNDEAQSVATVAVADLELSLEAMPKEVAPGGATQFELVVANRGGATAADVVVTDTLPAPLVFEAATHGGTEAEVGSVRWALGSLGPGAAVTLTMTARVAPDAATGQRVLNRSGVRTSTREPDGDDNQAAVGLNILPSDLLVAIAPHVAEARAGERITHTVTVHNAGGGPAESVVVDLELDANTQYVSDTSTAPGTDFGREAIEGGVRWSRAVLPGPGTVHIDLVTRVLTGTVGGAEIVHRARVRAATVDTQPANNQATAGPVRVVTPHLWLRKTGPAEARVGSVITYTLMYGNTGDGSAPRTRVTDTLPAGVALVGAVPPASIAGPATLTWARGSLPAGGEDVLRVGVRVAASTTVGSALVNRAEIGIAVPGVAVGVATDEASTTVIAGLVAGMVLSVPDTLPVGGATGEVSVELSDAAGHPAADGTIVTFETTAGDLAAERLATVGGRAATDLVSGKTAVTATVTARADGVSANGFVRFLPGGPAAVAVEPVQAAPTVDDDVALRLEVRDAFGNPVADGTPVTLDVERGTVTPDIVATRSGQAAAAWRNTVPGPVAVTATSGAAMGTATVVFEPGAPSALVLVLGQAVLPVDDGRTTLHAIVRDQFGNAAGDGGTVAFTAGGGRLDLSSVAIEGGVAATEYLAGPQPGTYTVAASLDGLSDDGTLELRPADLALAAVAAGARGASGQIYPGELVTYTVVVSNTGLATARGVTMGAMLPRRAEFRAAASLPVTELAAVPPGLLPQAPPESVARAWQVPDLASGAALTLTLGAQLDRADTWTGFDTLHFQSAVTSTTAEASPAGLLQASRADVHSADLFVNVRLDADASSIRPGGHLAYEVSFGNLFPQTFTGARITSTVPAWTRFDHWQPDAPGIVLREASEFNAEARELVWAFPGPFGLSQGLRLWLAIDPAAPPETFIEHTVTVGSPVHDLNPENNARSDAGIRLRGVNLMAGLTGPDAVEPGEQIAYRVRVENRAVRDTATGVVVVSELPIGTELVVAPGGFVSNGRVTWQVEEIRAGTWRDFDMVVSVPEAAAPGTVYLHRVQASSQDPESYAPDNSIELSTTVVPGKPDTVEATVDREVLLACGDTATVTARVLDRRAFPVADGTVVRWSATGGTLSADETVTEAGMARVTFVSGTTPGRASLGAQVDELLGVAELDVVPGSPAAISLVADVLIVRRGTRAGLTATVMDACGNAVADGWPVLLEAERGSFPGGATTETVLTAGGRLSTTLSVGEEPGPLRVRAVHDTVEAEVIIDVEDRPLFDPVYLPLVVLR